MITVILIIHVILAICIILAVLMQKSEGGGLGIGGSSAGGGFMTARGTANFMTKLTAFLGGCFFLSVVWFELFLEYVFRGMGEVLNINFNSPFIGN